MNLDLMEGGSYRCVFLAVGVALKLKPVPWYGWLATILTIPCVLLDGYRGAVAISMSSLEVCLDSIPRQTLQGVESCRILVVGQVNSYRQTFTSKIQFCLNMAHNMEGKVSSR